MTSRTVSLSLLAEAIARGEQARITVRGQSMRTVWADGTSLVIGPSSVAQLRGGEFLVARQHDTLIAHRFIRKQHQPEGWFFQTKADTACVPDPWQPETHLVGRVLGIARSDGTLLRVDGGFARWRQRLIGIRERIHVGLHEWWAPHVTLPHQAGAIALDPGLSAAQQRLRWARNLVLQERLAACVRCVRRIACEPLVLKGQALLLSGDADPAVREMADLDLLIPESQAPEALAHLLSCGYRPHGSASMLRGHLDDQVLLEDEQGVLIDLHWRITGGWRYRDVLRVDHGRLWDRARTVTIDGCQAKVLSLEDQLLHLSLHLALDGFADARHWQDLQRILARHGTRLDWAVLEARAGEWRIRRILWLTVDTLVRRWQSHSPLAMLRRLRPNWWDRVALRALMLPPEGLECESRLRRHTRELLLMDRWPDRLYLLWRWCHPPRTWFQFKAGAGVSGR